MAETIILAGMTSGTLIRPAAVPTTEEKAALAGTAGTPSATNPFVTDQDPRLGAGGPHAGTHATGGGDDITPGAIGAATAGHDHTGVYDLAGSASGAVGTHEGAFDHGQLHANTNDPTADEKAALAGGALFGTPSDLNKYITQEYIKHSQQIEVCHMGKGDFMSIKDAVDSITDASASKPYVVLVRPGVYVESPFSMKSYVSIMGMGGYYNVIVQTNDNNNHFISGANASEMWGLAIDGPTGTGYAAIYHAATGFQPLKIINSTIRKGYYGIWAHNDTTRVRVHFIHSGNWYAGSTINKFFYATGYGNITVMDSAVMSGPPGAVTTLIEGDGANTEITADNVACRIGGSTAVRCTNSSIRCKSISISEGSVAFEVSGTGMLHASGEIGEEVTTHFKLNDATAMLEFSGKADKNKIDNAAGGTIIASFGDETVGEEGQVVLGELWLGTQASSVPLRAATLDTFNTGWVSGGDVTPSATPKHVDVSAGVGFINTGTQVKRVVWSAADVTVQDNTMGWVVVDGAGVVSYAALEPSYDDYIILAAAGANTIHLTGITEHRIPISQMVPRMAEYLEEVVGPICAGGCVATINGTNGDQIDVAPGAYYRIHDKMAVAGGTAVSFYRHYRDGSGGWVVTAGSPTVDLEHWDDGSGTLADTPVGKYNRDNLYVVKYPGGESYHYVYSQEVFDSQILAESGNNPVPMDMLISYGMRICAIIEQQGSANIISLPDQRPFLGQFASGSTAVTDHGNMSGLGDDDHPQYFNQARGDARYPLGTDFSNHTSATAAHGASGAVVGTTNTQVLTNKTLNETDSIRMDVTAGEPTYALGTMFWDGPNQTLGIHTSPDTTVQVGQETVALCYNHEAFTITNGQIVRLSGAQGDRPAVHLADASTESESYALGMATQDIAPGAVGFVTIRGVVRGLDTQAYTEGALLYLSETPGALTMTKPAPPAHACVVGRALNSKANGAFFISVSVGHELDELHDVLIGTKADNDLIVYEQSTGLWKNKQLPSHSHTGVYEPANANIQTHIGTTGNPHGTTAADVGASPTGHDHSGVYEPAGAAAAAVSAHEGAFTHSDIAHSNRTALDNVSGVNTGDQDLSGYSLTSHNHTGVYMPVGGVMNVVKKAADTTRTNTAALTSDPDLQFALAANSRYMVRGKIFYDTTAAADFKWRHNGGAATVSAVRILRQWVVPGGTAFAGIAVDVAFSAADLTIATNAGQGGYISFEGIIQTTGTPGTFAFQWAQNTADAGNTTVFAGSTLEWLLM